jgi:predicted component of type VI protein secretion system
LPTRLRAVVHCKGTDYAAFFAWSAQKPKIYD